MRNILIIIMFTLFASTTNADIFSASEGELHIKSDKKGAYIYIDGKKKGMVGDGFTKITVKEGDHNVRVLLETKEWNYEGRENTFVSGKSSIEIFITTSKSPSKYRLARLKQEKIDNKIRKDKAIAIQKKREEGEKIAKEKRDKKANKSLIIDKSLDSKRGTVSELKLMWMRCSIGQKSVGNNCKGRAKNFESFGDAKAFLQKGYKYSDFTDWRIPTTRELLGLVRCSKGTNRGRSCTKGSSKPTINKKTFPDTYSGSYWSLDKQRKAGSVTLVMFDAGWPFHDNYPRDAKLRLVRTRN